MTLQKAIVAVAVGLVLAGCVKRPSIFQEYYSGCVQAGYNEGECKMRTLEFYTRTQQSAPELGATQTQRAFDAFGKFGEALQKMQPPTRHVPVPEPEPPRQLYCYPGGGGTMFCQ